MSIRSLLLAALAAIALVCAVAGCQADRPWPPEPVSVHFGEDDCASCKMIISDDRHAAELVSRDGAATAFDDIGCLLTKVAPARPDPQGVFVRAYDGSGWVRGDRAVLVRSPDLRTPMGFGFAAFASREAAEAEATRHPGSTVMRLEDLLQGAAPIAPLVARGSVSAPEGDIQP